jgi:tRNA-specific 2-thiouridylase
MNIAMLVSGGVDSSVALRRLVEAGHTVTAFYLKIWLEDEMAFLGECPWEDDLVFVRAVCEQAGVPLEVVPFQKEYWERIVSYTIDEVKRGRTPNPDVLCNTRVKFGAFYEFLSSGHPERNEGSQGNEVTILKDGVLLRQLADQNDSFPFDKIATGHYAQVEIREGIAFLKMSPDPIKDQTYFLSQLTQSQVARALFPIGDLPKAEVRRLAEQYGLLNAKRPDSQGLCFLGKIRFDKFLEFHLGTRTGDIVDWETKQKLGEHQGFWYYTIGQRRGIHLSGGPWFVVAKDTERNIVYVSNAWRSFETARDTFTVEDVHWISGAPFRRMSHCETSTDGAAISRGRRLLSKKLRVKIRHGAKMYESRVKLLDDGRVQVTLDEADMGISPGQFAVFYDGEYCLGGGVIGE